MQNNNENIQSFKIKELFNVSYKYQIPIYQRNYAWQEAQVIQLVQDIADFSKINSDKEKKTYYIGTLVVYEKYYNDKKIYETIDGQQRLTTLVILLSVLKNDFNGNEFNNILSFESRESSKNSLKAVFDGLDNKISNPTIKNAYQNIKKRLKKLESEENLDKFKKYLLENVEILRVCVPEDTDLNHYFEIMNNRGEQLEKHEVLKAQMLGKLKDENDSVVFAKIWEACSDMSRYVQYGFTNTDDRKRIFGEKWDKFIPKKFENIDIVNNNNEDIQTSSNASMTIDNIIDSANDFSLKDGSKIDDPERFTSPINFQNFLLHVLRIQVKASGNEKDIALDDKRLLDTFELYIEKENFVKEFGFNLLKSKYLFDNYILKRDYKDSNDGEWSLKVLINKKSAQYNNSFEDESENRQLIMLLSMFHVSNPSQIYKHWLTAVLNFLFTQDINEIKANDYIKYLENLAELFLKNGYLNDEETNYWKLIFESPIINSKFNKNLLNNGTSVENFIFNYLDYLLWKDDKDNTYKIFSFTFRSSVEHFYPQNPLDGQDDLTEGLDSFGNLCLISASKNSKLTNLQPEGKQSHYKKFDGVSPKQYLMMEEAKDWKEYKIRTHQEQMEIVLLDHGDLNEPK